jgi:Putative peptidoglycan-binding domain-containing protein
MAQRKRFALFAALAAGVLTLVTASNALAQSVTVSSDNGQSTNTPTSTDTFTNGAGMGQYITATTTTGTTNNVSNTSSDNNFTNNGSGGSNVAATPEEIALINDTTGLTTGSSGQDVTTLQGFLAELGFLDLSGIGGPTGYYGPMTQEAVARYQAAVGAPSTGYFGPITRESMAYHFVRNNWLDNLSSINGMEGANGAGGSVSGNAGVNTGGAEVDLSGPFAATNPGSYWYGVWYPNTVDLSVTASNASSNESSESTETTGSGTIDNASGTIESTDGADSVNSTDNSGYDYMGP